MPDDYFWRFGECGFFDVYIKNIITVLVLSLIPLTADAALNANMTVTTDYIFRGISSSLHKPALQGGLDYVQDAGLYAGTYATTVDFNDGKQARYELDLYFGSAGNSGAWSWDAGMLSFSYPGAAKSLQYDGYKYRLDLRHTFSVATLGAYYDLIPNYLGSGAAHYLEGIAIIPLSEYSSLDIRLGRQRITNNDVIGLGDFTYRSLTLQKQSGDWGMRLTWQTTGLTPGQCFAGQNWCRESVNVLVSRNFTLLDGQ